MPIPVQIVSGFLGAGKTTAIRAQLAARRGERVAIIVNDFGEAALDEATLEADEPFRITNIPGGCVCCTAPEGFVDALGAVIADRPDRLIVEPTGLARPQDLIDTIRRCPHREDLALAPVVVLVDPRRLGRESEDERALVAHQAAAADVLVANRTDLCEEADLERFDAFAAALWPGPLAVHRTRHGQLRPEWMEWPEGEGGRLPAGGFGERPAGAHAHDTTSGYRGRSYRFPPEQVFDRERLARSLLRMSEGLAGAPLARFKGIFHTREGFVHLEVAGGTLHERRSLHRRDSRADAIFQEGGDDPFERVRAWLEGAALGDRELRAQARQIEILRPDGRVRLVDREQLAALPGGVGDVATLFPKRSGAAARISSLWERLGLPDEGEAVICAADGFASEPVPVAALRRGLLLHSEGDAELSPERGGPFRLLLPAGVPDAPASCANVKGVIRIVLRPADG